ncbi:MAG: outer membrane beta-barrel protein [Myxococcota bacterium]
MARATQTIDQTDDLRSEAASAARAASGVAAVLTLLLPLLLAGARSASAQELFSGNIRGNEYTGPYAQFGVAVGRIDFDGNVDSDASGGFTMTGGYRLLPWLAGEANFTFLGGGDVEIGNNNVGDGQFFAFTFGPKFYPLGALDARGVPKFFQPYALVGIGGGRFEIDDTNYDESAFISRFILGVDLWATDNIGLFVEGGGHVTDEDDVDGVGIFTFGGQYRF